jgi:hypothetical protein
MLKWAVEITALGRGLCYALSIWSLERSRSSPITVGTESSRDRWSHSPQPGARSTGNA